MKGIDRSFGLMYMDLVSRPVVISDQENEGRNGGVTADWKVEQYCNNRVGRVGNLSEKKKKQLLSILFDTFVNFWIIFRRGWEVISKTMNFKKMQKIKRFFSPDFVAMATFLACNASTKLPVFNRCCVRMSRLFHYFVFLLRDASKAQ